MEIDEGRHLQGVLVETKWPGQQKPQFAVTEGGKWLENHSPTDEAPQAAPPPSQVLKMTRFASSGGNHPLPLTSARSGCFDVYSCVKNHPGPPQMPSDSNRMVEQGCEPTPTCLVIGTGLAAGLQGYGYRYKISTLAKPVPLATGIQVGGKENFKYIIHSNLSTQYIIYLHNTEEKKNVSKERGFIYRLPFACVCTLINKDTLINEDALIRVQAHAQ